MFQLTFIDGWDSAYTIPIYIVHYIKISSSFIVFEKGSSDFLNVLVVES